MANKYFKNISTLLEITENYPSTLPVFVNNGFEQMEDENMRKMLGKTLTLKSAMAAKKINIEEFEKLLIQTIETSGEKVKDNREEIQLTGLLPCPVRIPLVEGLDKFIEDYKEYKINYDLKAASMGLDWLLDDIKDSEDSSKLSDLFISAGFDLFFEEKYMGKFKNRGVFADMTPYKNLNSDFQNDYIDIRDTKGHYSMMSVVPAVFLVNKKELNGRKVPETWEDILKPEFERSISLPVGDFDLFNAIMIHLDKMYGRESIEKLSKSLLASMHPSEMVKSDKNKVIVPAVTIMPYFFTKMAKEGGPMTPVWPKDGAIISPIFLLAKAEKQKKVQPIVDFLFSKEVGEVLSHKGLFPSVSPKVDNNIPKDNKYQWIGWDYIYNNDIGEIIEECNEIFHKDSNMEEKVWI